LFINQLKQSRLDKEITQNELSKLIGKDQTFVSKYETCERRLDFIEFRQVCKAMNISLIEFIKKFEDNLNGK
jgi:transcriptional regulator with XRE-family HTH domain